MCSIGSGVEPQPSVPRSGVEHVVKHLPPIAIFRGCLPTVIASGMGLVLLESSVTRDTFHICHPTCQCGPEILSGLSCKFHAQLPLPLHSDIHRGKSLILKVPWALSECDNPSLSRGLWDRNISECTRYPLGPVHPHETYFIKMPLAGPSNLLIS